MTNEKYLNIYSAIRDILVIFADSEIGGEYEFNNDVIARYLDGKAIVDYWECNTKEEIYERFTQDIINGYPVWQMLILPKWTKNMVEKSFQAEIKQKEIKAKQTYKCLTCKYYKEDITSFGVHQSCNKDKTTKENHQGREIRFLPARKGPFELKKSCKYYEFIGTKAGEKGI